MQALSKHEPVERIQLPVRYRASADSHTYFELKRRYEDLKREYYQALEHIEEANREAWSYERMASVLQDRLDIAEAEVRRLAEAGRYAIYGKPKPELFTVDEDAEGEQDGGVER